MQKYLNILQEELHVPDTIGGVYRYWQRQIAELERKDINVNICDYDATLFGRKEQLETNSDLAENRGDKWIQYYMNEMWLTKFIDTYFKGTSVPDDIIQHLNPEYDLILSMWLWEAQHAKINANPHLKNIKQIFISRHEKKIIEMIRYIIFDLKFIPKSITVYEDRPEIFIDFREFIEDLFGCELKITKVLLQDNKKYDIWEEV